MCETMATYKHDERTMKTVFTEGKKYNYDHKLQLRRPITLETIEVIVR